FAATAPSAPARPVLDDTNRAAAGRARTRTRAVRSRQTRVRSCKPQSERTREHDRATARTKNGRPKKHEPAGGSLLTPGDGRAPRPSGARVGLRAQGPGINLPHA